MSSRTWVDVQKRTFTGWANNFLKERLLKISEIEKDLEDGVLLINLLEIISGKKFVSFNKNPRGRFQKIENNGFAVKFIANEGLKLVGIGAEDIVDGKIKLILGLIWTLILRYQIQSISAVGDENSPKQALLQWVKKQTESYNVPINDFDKSWQSGRALAALTDSLKPGSIPLNSLSGDPFTDVNAAMDVAQETFNIPKIMDPQDLVSIPDELSVMTYVSYFRDFAIENERLQAENLALEQERKKRSADPAHTYAEGPGLEGGINNETAVFTIFAHNFFGEPLTAGGENFHIEVLDEHGTAVQSQVTDKKDGTYNAAYLPLTPGAYHVKVTLGGTSIKNTPVHVNIEGADASKSYADGPGLEKAHVGKPANFTIYAKNHKDEPLKHGGDAFTVWISLDDSGESHVPVEIKDNGDGTYGVEYNPQSPGSQIIHIQLRDQYITSAPFQVNSYAATPGASYAAGPGLEKGQALKPAKFTIYGVDVDENPLSTGGDPFTVEVEGPSAPEINVNDNNDGTYSVAYIPTAPGVYKVHVKLFGHHIKENPVDVKISPAVDTSQTVIDGLVPGQAEVPVHFKIIAKDSEGNQRDEGGDVFVVDLLGPFGEKVPGDLVTDNGNGTYDVKFVPKEPGVYKVHVLHEGEHPIAGSPTDLHIKPAPSSQHSYAHGPGLESGNVFDNAPANFTIHAVDPSGQPRTDGGDKFHVHITGPEGVIEPAVHDHGDGTYGVTYEPTHPGEYKVDITLDHPVGVKNHIKNSPHHVHVREGTDASHSAFGSFTITVVAHDKHKKPKTFGGDKFEVSIKGPAEQIDLKAIDNGDGTYTAAYALVGNGRFDVDVKLNGHHISSSPFKQVLGGGKRNKEVPVFTTHANAN